MVEGLVGVHVFLKPVFSAPTKKTIFANSSNSVGVLKTLCRETNQKR